MKHQFLSMREEYEAQGARRDGSSAERPFHASGFGRSPAEDVREGRCGRQCAAVCARYCALRQRRFSFANMRWYHGIAVLILIGTAVFSVRKEGDRSCLAD